MSVVVRLATNYEKIADEGLLQFYCQNTFVALLLINFYFEENFDFFSVKIKVQQS